MLTLENWIPNANLRGKVSTLVLKEGKYGEELIQ